MRPRPVLHETEAETKTKYCETEAKKSGFETRATLALRYHTL